MGNTVQQWRISIESWSVRCVLTEGTKGRDSSSSAWFQLLVVMVLLVIGGVELNPGPHQSGMSSFEKMKGFADMAGELYEIKMLALLFLRSLQTGQDFKLASNMKAAGSFDDVVLSLRSQTLFLQLKHKSDDTVLKLSQLARHKDFNLLKYLKSYLNIEQQWQQSPDLQSCGSFQDAKFVIYTNATMDDNLVNDANCADLNIINTGGKCVKLTDLFNILPKFKNILTVALSSENVIATPDLWEVVHKLYNEKAQALPSKKQLEKMLEDIELLGNLTLYQQFVSQLYFCTGQMNEEQLDKIIKNEIFIVCGTDTLLREFKDGIMNWWRTSNSYLTVKAKFFQDIIQLITDKITKDVSEIKLKFMDKECDIIRQIVSTNNTNICLFTDCTTLTCIKVLQCFQTNLLVDVSTLQNHLSEVLAVWTLGSYDILVVEGKTTDRKILQKLAIMPNSKHVVLVVSDIEDKTFYCSYKFLPLTDSFSLTQLHLDSQREVLECKVLFQGFHVKLNSLADVCFLKSALTADVVVHFQQIGHKLHDLDSYYLPRIFLRREFVSEEVFREEGTFAVTGIPKIVLASLVPNGEKIQKFNLPVHNVTKNKTCRYFLINGDIEFTALCELNDNIHWIEKCAEGYIWKKSKGDISSIIKHLDMNSCVGYSGAEKVVTLSQQVVLVIATPGMGKSTEMCNIAHIIKKKDASTWVIWVDLNQCTDLLSQNHINAVEFLETVASLNTKFEKLLFEHQLESKGNVVILLDGFDEISPIYSHRVFRLLEEMKTKKIKTIFITSRPFMRNELQQKLQTLAFSFRAFTAENQENFLTKYWTQSCKEYFDLSNFISSLLQLTRTSSLSDKFKKLTGIPLQCKMLAEVFQDEASHYCLTGKINLPPSLDVLQLYDKFVDKKWEVYCKKLYGDVKSVMLQELIRNQKRQLLQNLTNCAMFSYLDEEYIKLLSSSRNIFNKNEDFIEEFMRGEGKTGIVTHVINDKAVFVHRTFAEYFVAVWFSEHLNLEMDRIKYIYLVKNFKIVQTFLDRILAKKFKLHTAILNKDLSEVKNLLSKQNIDVNEKDEGGRTALHLAVMNYYYSTDDVNDQIVETLLKRDPNINCEDNILHWKALKLAEEIKVWFVVDKLLEKQIDSKALVWTRQNVKMKLYFQNPLQVLRSQGFIRFILSLFMFGLSVQYCVSDLLNDVLYTALQEGYVNLVIFILKCGVSVAFRIMDKTGFQTSMLHIAVEHGHLRLVLLLLEQGANIEITGGQYSRTPLMQAAMNDHFQVVEELLSHGASINTRDENGHTALFLAAYKGKIRTIELLLKNKADVEIISNVDKRTALMAAAAYDHVQSAKLLLKHGAALDTTDAFGYTALLLAAHRGNYTTAEFLLKEGADTEIPSPESWDNGTVLMWAVYEGKEELINLLLSHGASVNAKDDYGRTALVFAEHGPCNIIKLLEKYL